MPCDAVVLVASRLSNDQVYHDLVGLQDQWQDHGIKSVKLIGDAAAPGPIAWATYAGHRFARELDEPDVETRSLSAAKSRHWRSNDIGTERAPKSH